MSKPQIKTSFLKGVALESGGSRESSGRMCPGGYQPETRSFIQEPRILLLVPALP